MTKACDFLCFLSVAAATWLGCAYGLVSWTGFIPEFSAWLRVLLPLVPAVWLGISVARWRPPGGHVQIGLFALVLAMAAPASLAVFVMGGPIDYNSSLVLHPETGFLLPGVDVDTLGVVGEASAWIGDDSEIPSGMLLADGRSLAKAEYPALFDHFGETLGGDDDTFNLPDYRGMYVWAHPDSDPTGVTNYSVSLVAREGGPRVGPLTMFTEIRWLLSAGE